MLVSQAERHQMTIETEFAAVLLDWRHALVESVRRDTPDLSARQMALLLTVYLTQPPHTVRGLAQALNISKPAVTRALDRLQALGYIRRAPDEVDRRNVLIGRTAAGSAYLKDFARMVSGGRTGRPA